MKALIGSIVVLLLLGGGYFLLAGENAQTPIDAMMENDTALLEDTGAAMEESNDATTDTSTEMEETETTITESDPTETADNVTVTYTNDGYTPKEVTVAEGGSVTWVNNSSRSMWPASARHPTHTLYPGSDIQKCDSAAAGSMFDACKEVPAGERYTFIFNEVGEWGYHDHANASRTGTVIVVE